MEEWGKRKKGKKRGKGEEKRKRGNGGIGVKKSENILILFPYNIIQCSYV